jgi:predicted alpha/beta superfamily hydrolase
MASASAHVKQQPDVQGRMRRSTSLLLLQAAMAGLHACSEPPVAPPEPPATVGGQATAEPLPGIAVDPNPGITGSVRMHPDVPSSDASIRARNVVVWLPPGYADAAAATQRYPVLYMHDGQNAFDPATAFLGREWHADEVADRLVREGRIPPLIIVGIWNTPDRVADYTPDQDPDEHRGDRKPQGRGGNGKAYLAWIATELKPMIDRAYRTRPERTSTAMMGSSLGGIISLAAAEERPETFGRIAAVSPSLWWNGGSVIDRWSARPPAPDRLWICMGDRERAGLDAELRRFEQAIRAADPGLAERMHAEVVAGGTHDEPSWSARLDRILEYLLAERGSGAEATKDSRPRR